MEKMRVYPVFYNYRYYLDNEWHKDQKLVKIFADRNDAIAWIKKQTVEYEVTNEEYAGDGWYHLEFVTTDWEGDYIEGTHVDTAYQISGYPYYVE